MLAGNENRELRSSSSAIEPNVAAACREQQVDDHRRRRRARRAAPGTYSPQRAANSKLQIRTADRLDLRRVEQLLRRLLMRSMSCLAYGDLGAAIDRGDLVTAGLFDRQHDRHSTERDGPDGERDRAGAKRG